LRAATSRHAAEPDADAGRMIWRIWLSEKPTSRSKRINECDRGLVVSALPRPPIVGLQDVKLLVVAQGRTRHARALRQLSDRQQLTVDHLAFKGT